MIRDRLATLGRVAGTTTAFVEGATGARLCWDAVAARVPAWDDLAARLGGGTRVGLVAADPLTMAADLLAGLAAGVTLAPLDPAAPEAAQAAQAADLGLGAVVGGPAATSRPTILWAAPGPRRSTGPVRRGATLVMASSGTTGPPKLIPLEEAALVHTATAIGEHHGLTPADRGYSSLPLFHINGIVVGVLSTLMAGSAMVLDRRFSRRATWGRVEEHAVTWCNFVPAIISILADSPPPEHSAVASVAFARSASAPLADATRRRFEATTGIGVLETYGMTEAASQITANPRRPDARRPGSVGLPVGVDLRVVDGDGAALGPDRVGRLQIRGRSVCSEYWAAGGADGPVRPARDAHGWLDTGDVGHRDADGFVHLAGRQDDVINRGGEKLHPRVVEDVLLADPGVAAAAVVGRPHPTIGEEPVAFVTVAPGCAEPAGLPDRLSARCAGALARYQRPVDIVVVANLPTGPTGKVSRRALRETFPRPVGADQSAGAPP